MVFDDSDGPETPPDAARLTRSGGVLIGPREPFGRQIEALLTRLRRSLGTSAETDEIALSDARRGYRHAVETAVDGWRA